MRISLNGVGKSDAVYQMEPIYRVSPGTVEDLNEPRHTSFTYAKYDENH
ncbi:hypothetical protein [Pedobacter namyangjuensis]|nr:hypothetical protein [Pedobacter namyangjuensis]